MRSTFDDAIRLVAERGRCMQEAVPAGMGAMAAILGLDDDQVRAACAAAAQGEIVEAVNFNSPGQVVVAGHEAAVERAMATAKTPAPNAPCAGRQRALALQLMQPAAEAFASALAATKINAPQIPVIHNADVARAYHAGCNSRRLDPPVV